MLSRRTLLAVLTSPLAAHAAVSYRWITQDKLIEVENSLVKVTIDTFANSVKGVVLKSAPTKDFFSYTYSDLNGDSPSLNNDATFFIPNGFRAQIIAAGPDLFDISLTKTVAGPGVNVLPFTVRFISR
jgi:hypothetical protein